MNLILHIVGKDLEMLGGRVGVWLAVVAVKSIAGIYLVGSADLRGADFGAIQGALLTLSVTDVALTFLIAGLLVHADGVAGSDAGWRTRPIAGWRLLVAKLMTAGLALMMPAVVLAWPWWWYCGFGGSELAVASLELAVLQAMIVLPVMTVASVTRTLPQLAIWSVVGVMGVLLTMGARMGLMRVFGGGYGERMMVFALLVLVLVAVVLPWHYARRDRYRTVTALAAGALLAALGADDLAGICRPGAGSGGPGELRVGGSSDVKVELASARVDQRRPRASEPDTVRLRYRVEGVPKPHVLGSGVVRHSWAKAGESFSVTSDAWGTFASSFIARNAALKPEAPMEETGELQTSVVVGPDRMRQLREGRWSYRARVKFELERARVTETAFAEGGWQRGDGRGFRIQAIAREAAEAWRDGRRETRERQGALVVVLEAEPASTLGDWTQERLTPRGPIWSEVRYVLRNVTGSYSETHGGQAHTGFTFNGVRVRPRTLAYNGRWQSENGSSPEGAEATLRLVAVDFSRADTVTREVELPQFELSN